MTLKNNWQTGDIVTAVHLNAIADEVNETEFDATAADGEKFPVAMRAELFNALFTNDGDGTWSVGTQS